MTEELVIVRQLPEIEENLKAFKAEVDAKVSAAVQMVCTEDTLAAVKSARAELGKEFKSLEDQRKAVKKMILAPYEAFEKVYFECVSDAFRRADTVLKSRIDEVETELKAQKAERIKAYYDEYCEANGIDFIPFERHFPDVLRSVSEKKYKEACAAFIAGVVDDLEMIDEQEYADEVRAEYKKTLNAAQAVTTVAERHRAIEEERKQTERKRFATEELKRAVEKVNEAISEKLIPPVEEPQEQVFEVTFTVHGTRSQIKELRNYLLERGYINE